MNIVYILSIFSLVSTLYGMRPVDTYTKEKEAQTFQRIECTRTQLFEKEKSVILKKLSNSKQNCKKNVERLREVEEYLTFFKLRSISKTIVQNIISLKTGLIREGDLKRELNSQERIQKQEKLTKSTTSFYFLLNQAPCAVLCKFQNKTLRKVRQNMLWIDFKAHDYKVGEKEWEEYLKKSENKFRPFQRNLLIDCLMLAKNPSIVRDTCVKLFTYGIKNYEEYQLYIDIPQVKN